MMWAIRSMRVSIRKTKEADGLSLDGSFVSPPFSGFGLKDYG